MSNRNRIDWLAIAGWIALVLLLLVILNGCKAAPAPEPGKGRSGSELAGAGVEAVQRGIVKVEEALPLVTVEKPRTLLESSVTDFREAIERGTEAGDAARKTETALAQAKAEAEKERRAVAGQMQTLGMWIAAGGALALGLGLIAFRRVPLVAEIGGSLLLAGGVVFGMGWAFGQWWLMISLVLACMGVLVIYFVWGPLPNVVKADDGVEIE